MHMSKKYKIRIKTADQYLAGTDANIFIKLYGAIGISPEIRLNGHISGNAFERGNTDECTISLDDDCGDIYMIKLRSDMLWAGADWLCDFITIQREQGAAVTFQLPSGVWIDDTSVHQYHATSGYDYNLPEHTVAWKKIYGACHYIPPRLSMDTVVKTTLSIDVKTSEVSVTDTSTKTQLKVEIDAIEAAFEFQINSSLTKQLDNQLHKEIEISSTIHIPESDKERTLQEVWSECDYVFSAQLGGNTYSFTIPDQKVFSGFKEIPSLWPETYSVE